MKATRMTNQKLKVLDYVHSVHTHPAADVVYKAVKKYLPAITLATVYRNLNSLAGSGQIQKLEINGEYHFDGETGNHQHIVCNSCGVIGDVFQKNISEYALKTAKFKGFKPERVQVIFRGVCKKCS